MMAALSVLWLFARLAFDRRFRREWELECALEDGGEDGAFGPREEAGR